MQIENNPRYRKFKVGEWKKNFKCDGNENQ